MRKLRPIFILLLLSTSINVNAQTAFTTMDSVDINNLHVNVLMHGDMWNDPITGLARCYSTNDSVEVSGGGGFWMSGYDASAQLHVSAETYRAAGVDFWPGPLDGALTYATSQNWSKIWKVNRTDIQYFQHLSTHTVANTPQAILTWPAKGNIYAQGSGGASLSVTNDMAPFVDLNGNGIYEPLSGEYPDVKGDQALWWVWSDNGPTHSATHGNPLGIEIHALAYGYSRGTLIDNVIYYEYTLLNRSENTYSNFRFAQWNIAVIGYPLDNFISYDSTWRMGITYKGTNDDGSIGGHPLGTLGPPPMSAVTTIVLPGDAGSSYVQPGSFTYFNNDLSGTGNPTIDTEYNNYMRAKNRAGMHLKNDFAGPGIPCPGYGSGPDCNYVFPGDTKNTAEWSECSCNNNPGERRSVLSSNDFTLNAGSTQKVVLAFIATNKGAGGCPEANLDSIKIVADTAWSIYHNPLPPLSAINIATQLNNTINIFPNPAGEKLFIENKGTTAGEVHITIYNVLGQIMNVSVNTNGKKSEADISRLPVGLYYVLYRQNDAQQAAKFVKQ